MGYHYFDTERYSEAFDQFNRVDREYFASIEHHWRNLKTDELLLVCQLHGEFDRPEIATLSQLTANYIEAKPEDRAVPLELVNALVEPALREQFDCVPEIVAAEVVKLIVGIGDQQVFQDQLANLQAAAGMQ
ncbi:MAG: hypothetical protein Aurels2KO_45830 [Aureliella sp.]